MILKYFSQHLQSTNKEPTFEELILWLKERLELPPKCHEDKIIQAEIYLAQSQNGNICLLGKSKTGRNLVRSLYHYILGCQNINAAREHHNAAQNPHSDKI